MQRWRDALHVGAWIWLAVTAAAWLHGPLGSGVFWPLTLPANVLHELALGGAAVGLVALLWLRRFSVAVLLLIQPIGLWAFAEGLEAPHSGPLDRPFRAATMNVGHLLRGPRPVIDHLRSGSFDLVALQEVDVELQQHIERDLIGLYPHQRFERRGAVAVGVLSKHPLIRWAPEDIEAPDSWFAPQRFTVELGPERIEVLSHHVWVMACVLGERDASLRDLIAGARRLAARENVLLLGDWNSTPTSSAAATLRRMGYQDAFQAVAGGFAGTYARRGPLDNPWPPWVRIDHAMVGPGLQPVEVRIGPDLGADHRGIELLLDRGPAAIGN